MTMHLQRDLEKIRKEVLHLGALVRDITHLSVEYLGSSDSALVEKIAKTEEGINELEVSIDEECLKILENSEKVNFIVHWEASVINGKRVGVVRSGSRLNMAKCLFTQLYECNQFSTSAVICRRSLLLENNGFDEHLRNAQDYDLWLKLSRHIHLHVIEKILGEYTIRDGNISSGPLFARLRNEFKIAFRYSADVSVVKLVKRVSRILLSFWLQALDRLYRSVN